MFMSRETTLLLLFTITLSNAASNDSYLLSHYDFKVKNNEATCRLVNHPNLPESRRTLAGRPCMCDEECSQYKDCCKDSVYYRPNEQSVPASHHCGETTAVYLMAECPSKWQDEEMRIKCDKSIQPLEDEDILMILPVANKKTRKAYGNRHCAICNNDMDTKNWVQFPMGVICGEAPPGYLKPDLDLTLGPATNQGVYTNELERIEQSSTKPYTLPNSYLPPNSDRVPNSYSVSNSNTNIRLNMPSEIQEENCDDNPSIKVINNYIAQPNPGILLDIHINVYNDTVIDARNTPWPIKLKTVVPTSDNFYNSIGRRKRDLKNAIDFKKYFSNAKEIGANAVYSKINKEFVSQYENKKFICRFGAVLPENSDGYTRRCVPFLEKQCPDGYENETIKGECSIHTNIVYNKQNKKPYRNKDCARCNGEKEDDVDGEPQDTRTDLSNVAGAGGGGTGGASVRGPYKSG